MTIWVTVIDSTALGGIRSRLAGQQASLAGEAARYTLVDYEVSLTEIRRAIRSLLLQLPDAAFDAEQCGDCPTAGQIVVRLCETASMAYLRPARAIVGLPALRVPLRRVGCLPRLSRAETLTALDVVDRELLEVLGTASSVDLAATWVDPVAGRVRLRDLLLRMALDEDARLRELAALASGTGPRAGCVAA